MTAQELYITGLLESFSTFCERSGVSQELFQESQLALVTLFKSLGTTTTSLQQLEAFLLEFQKHSQISDTALALLMQFVKTYPPLQTAVFLRQYLLAVTHKGCSQSTIKNYRSDINQFFAFCKDSDIEKILVKPKLLSFLRNEYMAGASNATLKRKLSSLTQFGLWLSEVAVLLPSNLKWLVALNKTLNLTAIFGSDQTRIETETTSGAHPSTTDTYALTRLLPKTASTRQDTSATSILGAIQYGAPRQQEHNFKLKSSLQELQARLHKKTNQWLFNYLNIALLALFVIGLSYFGYLEFFVQPPATQAFPASLNRPNRTLSFQGRLTDTAQNPITAATNMRFRLYNSGPSIVGGTLLWDSGTCSITPDQDGIFNTGLGSDCGAEIDSNVFSENTNVWLQVEVAGETLSPRQSIKTVPYAINAETLQGFPPAEIATPSSVLVMNSSGEVVLGTATPKIKASTGTLTLEATALTLQTTANGNIALSPNGLGNIIASRYIAAPGATLSATYAGGTALVTRGGPSGTGNIQEWQNSAGTALSIVNSAGNFGIGTTNASQKLTVSGDAQINNYIYFGNGTTEYTRWDGSNFIVSDDILPSANNANDLGAPSTRWNNIYGTTIYQNGNQVCDASGNCPTNEIWQNTSNVFHPENEYADIADLVIGGNSTASADFQVIGSGANAGYVYGRRFLDRDNTSYFIDPAASGDAGIFNGNIGIGTTTTAGNAQLDIVNSGASALLMRLNNGTAQAKFELSTANVARLGTTTNHSFEFITNNSIRFKVMNGGNVGIASTNPTALLDVAGDASTSGSLVFRGSNPSTIDILNGNRLDFQTSPGGDANLAAKMTLLESGNLGIGTTNPGHLLELNAGGTTSIGGIGFGSAGTIDAELFRSAANQLELGTNDRLNIPSASVTTGIALNIASQTTNMSSGELLAVNKTGTSGSTAFTGDIVDVSYSQTFNSGTGLDSTGNTLDIARSITLNNSGNTHTISGALVEITDDGTQSAGTLAHTASVIDATQNYAASTGTAFYFKNYGSGTSFRVDDAGGDTSPFIIANDGNVGIGTTAASRSLHVQGDMRLTGAFYDGSNSPGSNTWLLTSNNGTSTTWVNPATLFDIGYWKLTNGALHPRAEYAGVADLLLGGSATASAKFAFINVAAGTPTASISGNLAIAAPTGAAPATTYNVLNGGTFNLRTSVGGDASLTSRLFVANNGNVGIGSASPQTTLDIAGTASASGVFTLGNNSAATLRPAAGAPLTLQYKSGANAWTTALTVSNTSGNVGIGTTNPIATLDVAGTASASGVFTLGNNSAATLRPAAGAPLSLQYKSAANTWTTGITLSNTSGNVGIGTTDPIATLDVAGTASASGVFTLGNNSAATLRPAAGAPLSLQYKSAANTWTTGITLSNTSGNVGIGTTTASRLLHVQGDMRLTGALYDSTNSAGSNTYILVSNGSGTVWTNPDNVNIGWWDMSNNALYPRDEFAGTADMLLGSTATASAKFAFINVAAGTPTASISGNLAIASPTGAAPATTYNILNGGTFNLRTSVGGDASLTSRLFVANNGNVGINSTSPAYRLDVSGTAGISGLLTTGAGISNTGTFTTAGGITNINASSNFATNINSGTSTGTVTIGGGSNSVAINSSTWGITSGGVASGLTGLSSSGTITFSGLTANRLVATNGSSQLTSSITSANLGASITDESGSGLAVFNNGPTFATSSVTFSGITNDIITGTNEHFAIMPNGTGNVGIGTATPTRLLHVQGDMRLTGAFFDGSNTAGTSGYILTTTGSGTVWTNPDAINIGWWDMSNNALYPRDEFAGTADMLLGSTATASAKFAFINVAAGTPTASISGNLAIASPTGAAPATTYNILNGGTFNLRTSVGGDASLTSRLFVANNGNVGIGSTSPQTTLDVAGTASVSGTVSVGNNSASVIQPAAGANLTFNYKSAANTWTSGITLSNTSGNVGIGTTAPSSFKLQVAGNIGPQTSDTYDLGSSSLKWRDIYTSRYIYTGNGTTYYAGDVNGDAKTRYLGVGGANPTSSYPVDVTGSIRTSSNAYLGATTVYDASQLTAQKEQNVNSVTVSGAGWYRVAHIDGSAGRGQQTVTLYTTGGSYTTYSSTIRWWHDWGTAAGITVISENGSAYWNQARVTDDGTNAFLEVYFTQAITSGLSMSMQYDGGYARGNLYSGTLSAGAGTVRATAPMGLLTAGTDELYLDTTGNLGIGTTNPSQLLHVAGNMRLSGAFRDSGDTPGALGQILTSTVTGTAWANPDTVYDTGWWDNTANVLHPRNEYAGVADLVIGGNSTASADFRVQGQNAVSGTLAGYTYSRRFLDIDDSTYYVEPGDTTTAASFNGDILLGGADQIDFADNSEDKVYWFSNTYGTGIESSTLTNWSATRHRWRIGGTSTTTGTQAMSLTSTGLALGTGDASYTLDVTGNARTTTDAFFATTSGNVGIGTTTAPLKLTTIGANGYPASSGTAQTGVARFKGATNNNTLDIGSANASPWGSWIQSTDTSNLATNYPLLLNPNGGNVGIGSTAPAYKLDVNGQARFGNAVSGSNAQVSIGKSSIWNSEDSAGLRIEDGTQDTGILLGADATNDVAYIQSLDPGTSYTTRSLLINPNGGNVGIGTTAPLVKFVVNGGTQEIITPSGTASKLRLTQTGQNNWDLAIPASSGRFDIQESGTARFTIAASSGNVGIGTTAPSTKLDVAGAIRATTGFYLPRGLDGQDYFSVTPSGSADFLLSNASGTGNVIGLRNSLLTFEPGGSEKMRIDASGNVGIGTTSPVAKLDVSTNAAFDSKTFTIGNSTSDANERIRLFYDGGVARAKFTGASGVGLGFGTGGTDDRMVINASGNVGIGTTAPNSRLEVVGSGAQTIVLKAPSPGSGSSIVFADGGTPTKYNWLAGSQYNINNAFEITPSTTVGGSTFTTPALTVLQNGNTGIGTTAPAMKLDVTGTVRISSTLYLGTGTTKYLRENGTDIQMINTDSGGLDFRANGMSFNYNNSSTASLTWYGGDTTADFFISNTGQGYFSGNVGIGTTTPSNTLDVNGTARVRTLGSAQPTLLCVSGTGVISSCTGGGGGIIDGSGTTNYLARWTDADTLGTGVIYDNGTNIGIGTTSPDTRFEIVNGSQAFSSNSVRYYNNVAHYNNSVSSDTGTMKITMPKTWSSTMMQMRIQGYNYSSGGGAWEVIISGYNFSGGPSWINHTAEIRGSAPFTQVRLAHDGTNNIVLLGDTSTVWNYPKITVSEFIAGHSNITGWGAGWSIATITSEAGITNIVTPTIKTYITSTGNLGIGTTAPLALLDVAGTASASGTLTLGNNSASVLRPAAGAPLSLQYKSAANTWATALTVSNTSGNIGIGTTNPSALLAVGATSNFTVNSTGNITKIGNVAHAISDSTGALLIQSNSTSNLLLQTTAGANVGIGTTITQAKLDVVGTASASGTLTLGDNSASVLRPAAGAPLSLQYKSAANTWATALTVSNTSGNIGIGTTAPSSALDVNGSVEIGDGSASAPSLTFGADVDTGLYRVAANAIGLATGGSARWTLDASGMLIGSGTSQILNTLGSSGDPSYSFSGDEDTGIYSPGGNILGIQTSGSERFRIDSSGNIGIGTTTPGFTLDVRGNATSQIQAAARNTTSGIGNYTAGNYSAFGETYSSRSTLIGNNVYADTVNTVGDQLLYRNTHASYGHSAILMSAGDIKFYNKTESVTAGNVVTKNMTMIIDGDNGNVGIGTTAPTAKTHINFVSDATNVVGLEIGRTASGYSATARTVDLAFSEGPNKGYIAGISAIRNASSGNWNSQLAFYTSNDTTAGATTVQGINEWMRITSAGNVGIGTTAPGTKLDVVTTSASDGIRLVRGGLTKFYAQADGTLVWGASADSGKLSWNTNVAQIYGQSGQDLSLGSNANVDQLYIKSGGNVGIGTTNPTEKLHINGGRLLVNGSSYTLNPTGPIFGQYSSTIGYAQAPAGGNFEIWKDDTAAIATFTELGNVGIGTTTPSNTLDVNGTMRVRTFGGAAANNVCADANGVLSTCSGSFVTGTGTTNYLARWTSTSGIGIGATYDDGTNVGIGDATPTGLLTVGNGDKFVVDTNGRLRLNGATEAFGSYVISYDTGAASFSSASTVYGVKGTASNSSTGGVIGVSSVAASTGSGSLGSLIGLYSAQRLNNAGGTVGASAGLYVDSPTVTAGTISNQYGIFINSQKVGGVTGAYGIYQFELNDINYFAGNTAIGTTAMPQATLDVGGTASASGTLTLGNNSASILRPAAGAPLSLQYKSAANTWATALTVSNTSGNIGIGTTNPVHLLEINGTAADAANGIGFGTSGTVDTEIFRGAAGRVDFGASDYLNIPSALATTNNALNVTSTTTTLSSGRMLNIQKTGASGGTAFTGDIVRVDYSHTYNANTGIGHTGNVLDISRALTLNTAGNTHTVSGALMTLSDTMTQTAGTLTHTASVIDATQNYTSSTGTAFYLKNYGSNTSTTLRVDDASGDGSPFIIDATGNVGIGSTTVSTRLHLTGAPAAGSPWIGQMLVEPGINDEHAAISLKTTWTGTDRIWTILAGSGTPNTNFRIYDSTAGADRLNINDVGNVGIGTTDPLRKFHLNGSTSDVTLRVDTTNADPNLTFTTLTQKDWSLGIDYSDSGKFKIDDTTTVGGSTRMTIDTAGNVGINTASPLAKLDILASLGAPAITTANQTAGSTSEVVMNHTWTGNSGWDLRLEQQHVSGSHLQYNWINEWSGTPYNVLTFYGSSVGIGTTTPTRQSHIYGAAQATGSITDAGNTGGTLYLQDSGGSLGNGGTLLFGASQGNFASIKGYINDGSSNTTGSLTFATRANATDTALTERMIIDRFGNVIEGNLYLGYGTSAYLSTYDANENLIIDPNGSGYTHFQGTTLYVDNTIYARSTIENDTGFVDIRQSDTTYGLVLRQTGDSNDWGNIEVNETTLGFGKNNSVGQMFLDDDGDLGIGTSSPSNRLHVQDYTSGSTTASINGDTINWGLFIFNDGNNANRKGIGIQAGSDSGTGTSKLLDFYDGDATSLGDITFTGTTVAYNTFTGGHYVQVPENVDASGYEFGTLICIDSTSTTTGPDQATYQASKCSQKNQGSVAGVYAAKDENKPNHHQIFAVGDGSALVTSENGAIKRGDSIVASSYAGYGMKADGPSVILGVAVKDWIPSDEDRTLVLPDGRIVKGTLLPVYYYPGVFHPGPNTYFNSEGELVINGSTGNYQVTAVNGGAVANVLTAMTGIFGKVKAGLVSTQDLVVEQSASITSLSVTNLTVAGQSIQSYVASLVQQQLTTTPVQVTSTPAQIATSSAQIANLSAQTITTNTATVSSSLTAPVAIIQDLQASTLTTTGTTALGSLLAENATISGSLTAEDLTVTGTSRLDILEAQQAELQDLKTTTAEILDATVSGTLYAENIYDLDGKISRALQQPSIMDIITNNLPEPLPEADPVTVYDEVESAGYTINPDMLSITGSEVSLINGDVLLTAQAAYVEKYLQVNGLAYIAQSLGVGETIILGNTTIISDRSIAYTPTSVDDIFYFQPTGEGKLDFLAGVLTIENGKVAITGSLTVAGTTKTETLLTNLIQPAEFGNPFQVQVAGISTESGELKKSRFEIINELGTPVATISAEGKANFAGGIGIGSETLTPPTVASGSSATVTASKTSGKSTLGAHATQITIESEQISENSLIYVTPVGSTQNQVLYVKSQTAENPTTGEKEGKFIVGFDQPINIDVNFNWWVVN